MKKILFIPIEIKIRELDSRLLIALQVLNLSKDWEIIIGHFKAVGQYWRVKNISNFVLLDNGPHVGESLYLQIFKKKGRVVLLDEEGGIYSESMKYTRTEIGNTINLISKFFLWGRDQKNKYFEGNKYSHLDNLEEKFIITGNPRFELSDSKYFLYFKNLNIAYKEKKYVLISCAFGEGNNIIKNRALEGNYWKAKGDEKVDALIEQGLYQNRLLKPFVEGIKKITENYPNEIFILRAHPVEDIEFYKDYFKACTNVKIVENTSIQEWLFNAKFLIHSGCTTAIEAIFANLYPICYIPPVEGEEEHAQTLTINASKIIRTIVDLINEVKVRLDNPSIKFTEEIKIVKKNISNIVANQNNDECSKRIAEEIIKIKFDIFDKKQFKFNIKNLLPSRLRLLLGNIKNKIFLGKSYEVNDYLFNELTLRENKTFNNLDYKDIETRINLFKAVNNDFNNIVLNKVKFDYLDKQLFKLRFE